MPSGEDQTLPQGLESSRPAVAADTPHCRGHGWRASRLHVQPSQGKHLFKPWVYSVGRGQEGQYLSAIARVSYRTGSGVNTSLEQIVREPEGYGNVVLRLNPKYPLAVAADAPKDLPELQGTLAQPNHSIGPGPEHGDHRGDSVSEQPQLGRAVRRAKCEWAWEGKE